MNRTLPLIYLTFILLVTYSCNEENKTEPTPSAPTTESKTDSTRSEKPDAKIDLAGTLSDFIPKGFVFFDTIYGDLNKDGREDCVLITKATDKTKVVDDEYAGKLDRNRRGIIVLLNNIDSYDMIVRNDNCFSSENEDGGVYFAPEMFIEIKKGKLFVHYAHGRYGYWKYNFRLKKDDFELIGYEYSENHGPVVTSIESINFLTMKRQIKENINAYSDDEENEVFKETWETLKPHELLKLSKIKDFDGLSFSEW